MMGSAKALLVAMCCWTLGCGNAVASSAKDGVPHPAKMAQLVPWLATNGLFGYRTTTGEPVIAASFDDARPFLANAGYAVAEKHGKYGVINRHGEPVLAFKYPAVKLVSTSVDGVAIAITKREYNAFWRVWNWQLWPEFDLLGGGNNGPALVTRVPRAVWSVQLLPSGEKLYSQNRSDTKTVWGTDQYWKASWVPDRHLPRDLELATGGHSLVINDNVWQINATGGARKQDIRAASLLPKGHFMVATKAGYRLDDAAGQPLDSRRFTRLQAVTFDTSQGRVTLPRASKISVRWKRIPATVYADRKGNRYLAPAMSKPLPRHLEDYQKGDTRLAARAIIKGTMLLWNLPHSDYFALVSMAGSSRRRLFLLGKDGHWNTQVPLYSDPHALLSDGRIIFEGKYNPGVLNPQGAFRALPLTAATPCRGHPDWFMGKDTDSGKYGVYDIANQRWQVAAQYDYLQPSGVPGVIAYSIVKQAATGVTRDQFGLLDVVNDSRITPPLYNRIDDSGRVTRWVGGRLISFYINRQTGLEYRSQ